MMALKTQMHLANIDALRHKYDNDHAQTGDSAAGRLSLSPRPTLSTSLLDTSGGGIFALGGEGGGGTCKTVYPK